MAYRDLVKQAATVNGTGPFTIGAVVGGGYQSIIAGRAIGETMDYSFRLGAEWENGIGTVAPGGTVSRSPSSSSNAGALVNFPAGTGEIIETVTAASLNGGLVNPYDHGFDIWLCAGQSNMVGSAAMVANIDIADPRIFQFGSYPTETATYQKIVTGVDPLKHPAGNGGLSPASWFSKTMAGMIPPNRKILLVPVAKGGTKIVASPAEWASGNPGGTLYETAIAQVNAAIAAAQVLYPNSRFAGIIWRQGESDGDYTISTATYATALKAVIAGLRSRITGAANTPFIIGGLLPEAITSHAGYPAINAAHIQVAAETARCVFVPGTPGFDNGDQLHENAPGSRKMGCAMAAAVPFAMRGISVPAAPATVPATMAAPVASAGILSASIAFTAPADGGAAITGYTVTASTGQTANGTTSPIAITMPASVAATFTIKATNSVGQSTASPASNSVTPTAAATVPATMAAPVATAGVTSASVAFVAPANGGSAITGYTVTASTGQTGTGASSPIAVNMPAGVAATFTAKATNSVGTGADSPASNSVTPTAAATAPATMAAPVATAGSGTVSVAYVAPPNGGATITGYTATWSGGQSVSGTANPLVITGVTNGVAGTATITATNSVGTSAASPASNSVTPAALTVPGAPTIGTAVAGDGYIDVAFTAPASNGGSAILDYTATLSTGQTVTGASSPIRVTAPNGTPATATVTARNAQGSSAASAASNSITPAVAGGGFIKTRLNAVAMVSLTESGVDPDFEYTGTGASYNATATGGLADKTMPGDGVVRMKLIAIPSSAAPMLGMHGGSMALAGYASMPFNLQASAAGYQSQGSSSYPATMVTPGFVPAPNDVMQLRKVVPMGYAEVSRDNGDTWTTIFTVANLTAGIARIQARTDKSGKFGTPYGTGLV